MFVVLTLFTFALCLALEVVARSILARRERAGAEAASGRPGVVVPITERALRLPNGVFVDNGHTWVELQPAGGLRVGMDRFTRLVLGRIDGVDLPRAGQEVSRGQWLFSVRQGDRKAAFAAPVSGVIASVNPLLSTGSGAKPGNSPDDCLKNWVCTMTPSRLSAELKSLRVAEEGLEWLRGEIRRLREFFATRLHGQRLGPVIPDGGDVMVGSLEKVDGETWERFVLEFLWPRGVSS